MNAKFSPRSRPGRLPGAPNNPKPPRPPDSTDCAYTTAQWCQALPTSRSNLFRLWTLDRGPRWVRFGSERRIVESPRGYLERLAREGAEHGGGTAPKKEGPQDAPEDEHPGEVRHAARKARIAAKSAKGGADDDAP
jgi:hypothetical protein